jgi:hypothetical protein
MFTSCKSKFCSSLRLSYYNGFVETMTTDVLTFKASNTRKLLVTVLSAAFVIVFYLASRFVPAGILQTAFAVVPLVAAISNIAALWLKRLDLSAQTLAYRSVWRKWSVPLLDIKSWKIRKNPGGPNASLELNTVSGQKFQIADLSGLSIGNPDSLGSALAARIKQSKN